MADLRGSDRADRLVGGPADDQLRGFGGDDDLLGLAGADLLIGGDGADALRGMAGADTLQGGTGADTLRAGREDDRLFGQGQDDRMGGGFGDDTMVGAGGADILNGSRGDDDMRGGRDADILNGQSGADRLRGEAGDDTMRGQADSDTLSGGAGDDRLNGNADDDVIEGGDGDDFLIGSIGADALSGEGNDDTLLGGGGADTLEGGTGADSLRGDARGDLLFGEAGADTLAGNRGTDTLDGGAGDDLLAGGPDGDIYLFAGAWGDDTVSGFRGADILDLSATGLAFADLSITDTAAGALVEAGGASILLAGVEAAAVSPDAFRFSTDAGSKTVIDAVSTNGTGDKVEIEVVTPKGGVGALTAEGSDLIGLDDFRNDPRFSGYDGSGYTVAVLDTGIDLDHPAFGPDGDGDGVADRIVYSEDFSQDGDGTADDVQGHGTHVASIAAGEAAAYTGVAPGADIVALQVLDNSGSGWDRDIEAGLQWVVDNARTYDIVAVNMSLGAFSNRNTAQTHPVYGDEFRALEALGVVVTVAAGNDYYDWQTPGIQDIAADPNAIGVGAVYEDDFGFQQWGGAKDFTSAADRLVSFSQRTDAMDTVFAPGARILGALPGDGTGELSGTSMAAPFVAGMVPLAQEVADNELGRRLTPDEVQQLLVESADTIFDGDDEDDNVANIGADTPLPRVDMTALAEAILALDGGDPTPGPGPGPDPAPADDYPEDSSTTGVVRLNRNAEGAIEREGDADWIRVSLEAGDTYAMAVRGSPTGDGTLSDPMMALLDSGGGILATNDDGGDGLNALLEYTAQTSGDFYIAVSGFTSATGTYTVDVDRTGRGVADDYPADDGTPSVVAVDGPAVTGELEVAGDRDWHRLDAVAGERYVIALQSSEARSPALGDTYLRVYDASGVQIAANDDGGEGLESELVLTPETDGPLFLEAGAYADAGTGFYDLSVAGSGADDIPDDAGTSASVAVGGTFESEISPFGDRDWIAVDLQGGAVYDIALAGHGSGPLSDPLMRIYDSAGTQIAFNDDFDGLDSRLEAFSVPTSGTYYISAAAFADAYEGGYRVSVESIGGGAGDVPADDGTRSTVSVPGSVDSRLDVPGDRDWHRASFQAGESYRITLEGVGADALSDPYLRVFDSTSTQVAFNDDFDGLNSELVFTASVSDDFYLSAGAFADAGAGDYSLTVEPLGRIDDYAGDSSTAGRVAPDGGSATGELEQSGDGDWFAVDVVSGGVYQFDLRGAESGVGTLADPVLAIRDRFGTEIGFDDDGGAGLESRATFYADATETIYLDVSAYADAGIGTYEIGSTQISGGSDDHPDGIGGNTLVPVGGARGGDIEESGDRDVFRLELTGGRTYEIDATGGAGASGLADPTLALWDDGGAIVGYDDDGGDGLDSRLTVDAPSTGVYYAAVEAFSTGTGDYELSIDDVGASETAPDDFGEDLLGAGTLLYPADTVTGELEEEGDRDWLSLPMFSGETVSLGLRGAASGAGTLSDPYLRVLDSAGTVVAEDNDSGRGLESSLSFTAPADDGYFVSVGAFADAGTGTWTLDSTFLV